MTRASAQRDAALQTNSSNTPRVQTPRAPTTLFDPVPGHPDADVRGLLHATAQIPGMQDAVTSIFRLEEGEPLPSTISDASCQLAAFLLMERGQGRLLCRLAEDRPIDYQLNIGVTHQKILMLTVEQKAQVLADISAKWPQSTPVSLTLCTSLSGKTIQTLQPFLLRPTTLNVYLVLDGGPDAAPAIDFAAALCQRALKALVVECHVPTPEALQALSGVQAQAVCVQIATPPEEALRIEFEKALVTLLGQSGATKLDVAHASVPAPLAARLLACRDHWVSADVRLEKAVNLLLITKKGKLKIDQLGVHALSSLLPITTQLLKLLFNTGVNRLIVHGALDVSALAQALQTPVATLGGYIHHIEACCMLPEGADFEQTIVLLRNIGMASTVSHLAMPNAVPGHRPLTADEAARLAPLHSSNSSNSSNNSNTSNSSMTLNVRATHPQQQVSDRVWLDAVQKIAWLLMPHLTVQDLVDYLRSPANKAVLANNAQPYPDFDPSSTSFSLLEKLKVLKHFGAPDGLVRKTLETLLRTAPADDMAQVALHALIDARFPLQKRGKSEAWYPLGQTVKTHWISDAIAGLSIDPSPNTATPPVEEASQPTSVFASTAGAITTIEPAADREPVTLVSLIHPSTPTGLAELMDTVKARGVAAGHLSLDDPVYFAGRSIHRLLEGGPLDMRTLPPSSQRRVSRLLLEEGQWKLLRHVVPTHSYWEIHVGTPQIAAGLANMAPWPSSAAALHLEISSTLSKKAIQDVATLASTTPQKKLSLTISANGYANAEDWGALAELVCTCPCATLTLRQDRAAPATIASLAGFLEKLALAKVDQLQLLNIDEDDKTQVLSLATGVQLSGIRSLCVLESSDTVVQVLVTCKRWSGLRFSLTPSLAALLENQIIVAQTLSLKIKAVWVHQADGPSSTDTLEVRRNNIFDTVNACKGVVELELWGSRFDIGDLAHILDRVRSITTVRCALSADSASAAESALALLRHNTSLRHFLGPLLEPAAGTGLAIERTVHTQVLELTVRNQFLSTPHAEADPGAFAFGAVKGWTSVFGDMPDELISVIAGMLDERSAQSLSVVNKATFVGSRQHWEKRILEITDGFSPRALDARAPAVVGNPQDARNPLLAKVMAMHKSGTPYSIIGEALGRRLHQLLPPTDAELKLNPELGLRPAPSQEELSTIPHLLEVMAYVGAIPPLLWLKEGLGIDPGD